MSTGPEYITGNTKRNLDVLGGLMLAGGLSPVGGAVAMLTMLERCQLNPIFAQQRYGKAGNIFNIYKFQTLDSVDAGAELHDGYDHPASTPLSKPIRQTGLDELPQLLNVINGDMSLVGIRPVPHKFLQQYRATVSQSLFSEWAECLHLNPGLTGEGQLYAKQFPEIDESVLVRRMEIEIRATERASLRNDLRILAITPIVLLRNLLSSPAAPEPVL